VRSAGIRVWSVEVGGSNGCRPGSAELENRFSQRAEKLRARFEEAFWCEDLSLYALAPDGRKRACRVRTSNAGQCLSLGVHVLRQKGNIEVVVLP
jgi:glycogen debranching enzyme